MCCSIDGIGLCEHCGKVVSVEGREADGIWLCEHCGSSITHESFGFDKPSFGARKVKWVGPGLNWVGERPPPFKEGGITFY